ncbi:MAG: LPS assembly protein LptD [Desulfovibrio sp.]|nr:LPS assembly protein LptD [Desulfovibrio sp.]
MNARILFVAVLAFLCACAGGPSHAAASPKSRMGQAKEGSAGAPAAPRGVSPLLMESEDQRLVRWELTADRVSTLNDVEVMEAEGNVLLKRGGEYLKADFARYYISTRWVYLKGNVVVRTAKDELTAEEAEFDLRSRVGWLKKGRIFMAGPHVYIAGDRIDKHWGDMYTFSRAKVTTCDGDVPAWSVTAGEAVLEVDGYARLGRSTFQINDVPVAYVPYFLLPTKTTRQTGLLVPEYGRSLGRGMYYNQPFFWALGESSDLTLNEYVMEKRGFMHGVEYRARPAADTFGWLRFDWLYDKSRDAGDTSGLHSGDGLLRTNYERFWLRGMFDSRLSGSDWRFKADVDYVSDQYFLLDFKEGFSGFGRSRGDLFEWFSRDLQEKDRDRVSGFLLSRDWDRFCLALSSYYTQNPALGHGNRPFSEDDNVQRMPQADAFLHKGRLLPALPLEVEAGAQAVYLHRRNGTRGARYEVIPRLTLPVSTPYGSLIAGAGVVQTLYETEYPSRPDASGSSSVRQTGVSRTLPEVSLAGATEFARVFPLEAAPLSLSDKGVGESRWTAFRHSVQPRLEYRYRLNEDQEDNPYYDDQDRLEAKSELVYSLTNVLTGKKESVVLNKDENGAMTPALKTSYADLLRLRVEQAYDMREASRVRDRDSYSRHAFGDIFSDLTVYATDAVSFSTRNNWSPYLRELTRHQSGASLHLPEYGSVYVGYDLRKALDEYTRKREDDIKYLRFDIQTAALGPWRLGASLKNDFKNLKNKETDLRLSYNHQCFSITGRILKEPREETYQLFITLSGLGD